ncbi:MAG TPA: DnaA N-terminal domain-containing protein [Herpetosiphonaceae bacterium]
MVAVARTERDTLQSHPPATAERDDREHYAARRTYAYELGEQAALQRVISAEAYLFLYKELVRLCKDRTYCWAGVAWMTQRLGVSEGTIKRWLRQLVDAGLIERTPRPGGDTALTRIPALVAFDAHHRDAQPMTEQPVSAGTAPPLATPPAAPDGPLFFAPAEGIMNESRSDSHLIRHTVKRPQRISGLVGGITPSSKHNGTAQHAVVSPTVQPLATIGVCGPGVLDELSSYAGDEIAAVCRYVTRQRNSYNPAGLAVFLARSGFGRTLVRDNHRSGVAQQVPSRSLVASTSSTADAPAPPGDPRLVDLWTQVQAQLAQQIPAPAFVTWVQETQLVALDDAQAVVGVPTIFAREQVQAVYAQQMGDVLAGLTGKRMAVEVVIDRSG